MPKKGLSKNICDALDLSYYDQFKSKTRGYKKFNISEHLKNINRKWCKIDSNASKRMKASYYEKWSQ